MNSNLTKEAYERGKEYGVMFALGRILREHVRHMGETILDGDLDSYVLASKVNGYIKYRAAKYKQMGLLKECEVQPIHGKFDSRVSIVLTGNLDTMYVVNVVVEGLNQ